MSACLTFLRLISVAKGPGDLCVFHLRRGRSSASYTILTLQLNPNHLEDPTQTSHPSCPTAEDGKEAGMGEELGEGMEKERALGLCKPIVSWAGTWHQQAEVTSQV